MKKNTVLVVGVFAGAVTAALLAWAVFGGSGGSRRAVLEEPTQAGSIGVLTLSGVVDGDLAARSFNWHAESQCTDGGGCLLVADPLEVLRKPGANSPALFGAFASRAVVASGQLDLMVQEGGTPYLTLAVTNGRVSELGVGKHEKVAVSAPSTAYALTVGEGAEPAADSAQISGQMTYPGEPGESPIYGVSGGLRFGAGGRLVEPIVIRRPLDHLAAELWRALRLQTNLGTIRVELEEPRERAPHIAYELGEARVSSLTISAAAGHTPTEEFALSSDTLQVSGGGQSRCWDFLLGRPC